MRRIWRVRLGRVWLITCKEFLQNRRDPMALLFTIVLPVIFTVFLGLLIPSNDEEATRLPLALADADGSPAAQELTGELADSPLLKLKAASAVEIDAMVQNQKVAAGLIIPKGFGAAVESGRPVALMFIRQETSTGAESVRQVVQRLVSESNTSALAARAAATQVAAALGRAPDQDLLKTARALTDAHLAKPAVVVRITDTSGAATAPSPGGFQQSSPGSLVTWLLFSLIGVCSTVTLERRSGVLRRLTAAGVRASEILGGKMLAMVLLSFAQQLLLVLLGQLAFGVNYFASPLALLVVVFSLSMLAAALGLFVISLFRSDQAITAALIITALVLAALGGAWFPLDITTAGFSKAAHMLPSAWLMAALHGITLKGWGPADILRPVAFVWVWIVGLLTVAVWRFRPD